jgi:hypothetical protein
LTDDVALNADGEIEVDECFTHSLYNHYENVGTNVHWSAAAYGRKDTNASFENT